jgi:hypothetical protein
MEVASTRVLQREPYLLVNPCVPFITPDFPNFILPASNKQERRMSNLQQSIDIWRRVRHQLRHHSSPVAGRPQCCALSLNRVIAKVALRYAVPLVSTTREQYRRVGLGPLSWTKTLLKSTILTKYVALRVKRPIFPRKHVGSFPLNLLEWCPKVFHTQISARKQRARAMPEGWGLSVGP